VPMACLKGTDQLDIELKKHEENKYLVLRRGVIEQSTQVKSVRNFQNFFLQSSREHTTYAIFSAPCVFMGSLFCAIVPVLPSSTVACRLLINNMKNVPLQML
jgi:hypothetical protein